MKTFASITVSFLLVLMFSAPLAFAAETESDCKPVQHLNGAEDKYVSPEVLRETYDVVREHMEAAADETIVLRYLFSAQQSRAIRNALTPRWGLQLDARHIEFVLRLESQRTQLVLVSEKTELARLDFTLQGDTDAAQVFASISAPNGHVACVEYTEMEQFFWGEIIEKMRADAYPEGFSVAME